MPSTRRQKARARSSSEADILSDIGNMDVLLGKPGLAENRLHFDLSSERSFGRTRDTNLQEIEIRTASENTNDQRNEMNLRNSEEMNR